MNYLKLIVLGLVICGYSSLAYAGRYGFPCGYLYVKKTKETRVDDMYYEREYYGEVNGYSLFLELGGAYEIKNSFIDCGTSGCDGIITNLKTKEEHQAQFDCVFADDDEDNAPVLRCFMIRCEGPDDIEVLDG